MKKISAVLFLFIFLFVGCETTSSTTAGKSRKISDKSSRLFLELSELEKNINGTWNVIETSTTEDQLENETKYTFQSDEKICLKKNLFHGYFEELIGKYKVRRKSGRNYMTVNYENGFTEKFKFYFETKNRLHMTYITGEYQFIYILERVDDDIFDLM